MHSFVTHSFFGGGGALQEKSLKSNRQAVEDDLELLNKEKQQKMNELDVVVPLRLHQVNSQKTVDKTTE